MSTRVVDERLRRRALEILGPLGDAQARAALETGSVSIEHDVLAWEGSHGTVHAHRVVIAVAKELHAELLSSHAARDGLSAALAAAVAEQAGQALADVRLEIAVPEARGSSPYRDPRSGGA